MPVYKIKPQLRNTGRKIQPVISAKIEEPTLQAMASGSSININTSAAIGCIGTDCHDLLCDCCCAACPTFPHTGDRDVWDRKWSVTFSGWSMPWWKDNQNVWQSCDKGQPPPPFPSTPTSVTCLYKPSHSSTFDIIYDSVIPEGFVRLIGYFTDTIPCTPGGNCYAFDGLLICPSNGLCQFLMPRYMFVCNNWPACGQINCQIITVGGKKTTQWSFYVTADGGSSGWVMIKTGGKSPAGVYSMAPQYICQGSCCYVPATDTGGPEYTFNCHLFDTWSYAFSMGTCTVSGV